MAHEPTIELSVEISDFLKEVGPLLAANGGTGLAALGTARQMLRVNAGATALEYVAIPAVIQLAAGNETSSLTVGTNKVTFRMPYAMTLTEVRISVNTAPTGAKLTVNIKESGTTIFSTKPTIDVSTKTSVGAAIPAVLSDTALADNAEMTVDIDQVGSATAGAGLKVTLIGTRA